WVSSPLWALEPLVALLLYFWTGWEWTLALPLIMGYIIVPLVDLWIGEDHSNVDDAALDAMQDDPFFKYLTYLTVPAHYITFFVLAWFIGTQEVSPLAWLIVAITAGGLNGLAINTAHELGHKTSRTERVLARILLALPGYGHFSVEHNLGHHRDVATPEDVASSRMGESIYRFMLRELPGALQRGWQAEKQRLLRIGKPVWSYHNQILQSYALSAVIYAGLIVLFGLMMLPFLIIQCFWAWFQLTSANYIEHYGLLREKTAKGNYESCKPHHSWNANSVLSNMLLFQLERHSDHHAHPTRRYQSLRNFEGIPQLPTGYFGMYTLAYVPWLWFKVMDKRLLAVPHINGDLSKVNIDPARRQTLIARYGEDRAVAAAS
ncbi:MAG: alkane 1-monooxygenase, partial [Pseudomonadales bacterium]|nr:alkane 1-monooxygenase [Pseudomonadales bacterium]